MRDFLLRLFQYFNINMKVKPIVENCDWAKPVYFIILIIIIRLIRFWISLKSSIFLFIILRKLFGYKIVSYKSVVSIVIYVYNVNYQSFIK